MSFTPSKNPSTRPSPTWLWARVAPCCRTCGKLHVGPTRPACETSTAQTLANDNSLHFFLWFLRSFSCCLLTFYILTNKTLVAVPHWFLSQEWQRKVRRSHRRLEFSQKRKPPNLRSCLLFIFNLFFSKFANLRSLEPTSWASARPRVSTFGERQCLKS